MDANSGKVRLAKPILLLMGVAHWVASFLFLFGGYLEALRLNGAAAWETSFRGQLIDGHVSSYAARRVGKWTHRTTIAHSSPIL